MQNADIPINGPEEGSVAGTEASDATDLLAQHANNAEAELATLQETRTGQRARFWEEEEVRHQAIATLSAARGAPAELEALQQDRVEERERFIEHEGVYHEEVFRLSGAREASVREANLQREKESLEKTLEAEREMRAKIVAGHFELSGEMEVVETERDNLKKEVEALKKNVEALQAVVDRDATTAKPAALQPLKDEPIKDGHVYRAFQHD